MGNMVFRFILITLLRFSELFTNFIFLLFLSDLDIIYAMYTESKGTNHSIQSRTNNQGVPANLNRRNVGNGAGNKTHIPVVS